MSIIRPASKKDRHLVSALHAQPVNRHIRSKLGIAGENKPHAEVRTGVLIRVGRSGQDLSQVEIGIGSSIHDFLTPGLFGPTSTGSIPRFMASNILWVSLSGGASKRMPTRFRLATRRTKTREPGKPVTLLKIIAGPIWVGRSTVAPAPILLYTPASSPFGSTGWLVSINSPGSAQTLEGSTEVVDRSMWGVHGFLDVIGHA